MLSKVLSENISFQKRQIIAIKITLQNKFNSMIAVHFLYRFQYKFTLI